MERIGSVLHVSSSNHMILKAEKIPHIGDKVVDESLNSIGVVFDVFGPVSSPYVVVRPSVEEPSRLVDHVLYAVLSSKSSREKRRR